MSSSMAYPRYSLSPSIEEDPIYRLKKLNQNGSIKDYYEEFDSIRRCIKLPEEFLISWFIAGLKVGTRKGVQSLRPQSVIQAYAYGRVYEIAYPEPESCPFQSIPTLKSPSLILQSPLLSPNQIQEDPSSNPCLSVPISVTQGPSMPPNSASLLSLVKQDKDHVLQSVQGAQKVCDLDPNSDDQEEKGVKSNTKEILKILEKPIQEAKVNDAGVNFSATLENQDATVLSSSLDDSNQKFRCKGIFTESESKEDRLKTIHEECDASSQVFGDVPEEEVISDFSKFIDPEVQEQETFKISVVPIETNIAYKVFDKMSNTEIGLHSFGVGTKLTLGLNSKAFNGILMNHPDEFGYQGFQWDPVIGEWIDKSRDHIGIEMTDYRANAVRPLQISNAYHMFDEMPVRGFKGNDSNTQMYNACLLKSNRIFDPGDVIEPRPAKKVRLELGEVSVRKVAEVKSNKTFQLPGL